MKNNKIKFTIWGCLALIPVVWKALVMMWACLNLQSVQYETKSVNAGDTAIFKMNGTIVPIADASSERLVAAICVPKLWNARESAVLTFTCTYFGDDINTMDLIPEDERPSKNPSMTWSQALWSRAGAGPNVQDDMEWIAYVSTRSHTVHNGDKESYVVTVKVQTSTENMKVKIGFFVNQNSEGMTDDAARFKFAWGPCLEVINGEGEVIDFCDLHANMNQPGFADKNDFISIKYVAGILENDRLEKVDDIYLNATASTKNGNVYPKTERLESAKMSREPGFMRIFSITFWPVDYFGIPADEEIERIVYTFSNQDGSLEVLEPVYEAKLDDDGNPVLDDDGIPIMILVDEVPFRFAFSCK